MQGALSQEYREYFKKVQRGSGGFMAHPKGVRQIRHNCVAILGNGVAMTYESLLAVTDLASSDLCIWYETVH